MNHAPFTDPVWTAKGERRASVAFDRLQTLWFNTGTRCNITCAHCYIESSPTNDRLTYLQPGTVRSYLQQAAALGQTPGEVGFTGGEPFLNPHMADLLAEALMPGHDVLVLTNAMRPVQRPAVMASLVALAAAHPGKLTLRVSLDHHAAARHDQERGDGAFASAMAGMRGLHAAGLRLTVAGRTCWGEDEASLRAGFAALFAAEGLAIDAADPGQLVLFPEMDASREPPEITTACWGILGKRPQEVMCASSRMVVHRRGAAEPTVLACTLLAYDAGFEMGQDLATALRPVALNHRHCATFCVLGGASCSA